MTATPNSVAPHNILFFYKKAMTHAIALHNVIVKRSATHSNTLQHTQYYPTDKPISPHNIIAIANAIAPTQKFQNNKRGRTAQ